MVDGSTDGDAYGTERSGRRTDGDAGGAADWLTQSALRVGLALLGVVLLLYALGRLVGVDLLAMLADALTSEWGRWIAVAVVALALIGLALRGFGGDGD